MDKYKKAYYELKEYIHKISDKNPVRTDDPEIDSLIETVRDRACELDIYDPDDFLRSRITLADIDFANDTEIAKYLAHVDKNGEANQLCNMFLALFRDKNNKRIKYLEDIYQKSYTGFLYNKGLFIDGDFNNSYSSFVSELINKLGDINSFGEYRLHDRKKVQEFLLRMTSKIGNWKRKSIEEQKIHIIFNRTDEDISVFDKYLKAAQKQLITNIEDKKYLSTEDGQYNLYLIRNAFCLLMCAKEYSKALDFIKWQKSYDLKYSKLLEEQGKLPQHEVDFAKRKYETNLYYFDEVETKRLTDVLKKESSLIKMWIKQQDSTFYLRKHILNLKLDNKENDANTLIELVKSTYSDLYEMVIKKL